MFIQINSNSSEIEINELGLKLNIKPNLLISKLMDQNGRNMLKEMMDSKFKSIIEALSEDKLKIETGNINSEKVETKEIILNSVLDFATFVRQISILSTEFELDIIYDDLDSNKKEIYDWAYSLIKYNSKYGFRDPITTKIDF